MEKILRIKFFAIGLGVLLTLSSAAAQDDKRVIKLIVPVAAGGSLDLVARIIAPKLSENLGRTIVIDNRAGAGGLVGAEAAAKSPSDGTTLFLGFIGPMGIFPSLYKKLRYDPVRDFDPVVGLTYSSNVLVASKASGFRTVADLVAAARKKPDALTMGSSGSGTTPHLSGAILNKMAGITTLHVPFTVSPITEIMAGRIDYSFESVPSALEFIKADKVTALAVSGPQRDAKLPNLPTLAESGFPGFSVIAWTGFFAPAKTPAAFINQVNAAANATLRDPEVIAQLAAASLQTLGGSPADLRARVQAELAKWPQIVKDAGAQVD